MPEGHLVILAILWTIAAEDIGYLWEAPHEKLPFLQISIQKIKGAFYFESIN